MTHLSPFYAEWIGALKSDLQRRLNSGDIASDSPLRTLLDGTAPTTSDILENYQQLLSPNVYLEKSLLDSFPLKEFAHLSRYYPRMYRGLPRLYNPSTPSQSIIKKNFTNLDQLKRQVASKALFSLYERYSVSGTITVFTWVIDDGLGDYMAAQEVLKILQEALPNVTVRSLFLVEKKTAEKLRLTQDVVVYEKECPVHLIPLEDLRKSDLILQCPTFYPRTKELMERLSQISSIRPMPKMECIGEYGFLESSWFHPQSGAHSMGLHFLEKGILVRPPKQARWEEVKNEQIRKWHMPENRFYLAYLSSTVGGAIYLHALLRSLEKEAKDIDLCVPDLGWFIKFVEQRQKEELPILEWDLGIKSIEVRFQGERYVMAISAKGKALRLLAPDHIDQNDFEVLLSLSDDFVATRGNQSFSEAVSQNKPFFYDGRAHSRYFFKDLVAIAENRLKSHPGTLACIRAMYQGFLHQLPIQTEGFVDETFFQPLEPWPKLADRIGKACQDPNTILGFKRLNQILREEFSAGPFLSHLVKRALCHRNFPKIAALEEREMQAFLSHAQSFAQMIDRLNKKVLL